MVLVACTLSGLMVCVFILHARCSHLEKVVMTHKVSIIDIADVLELDAQQELQRRNDVREQVNK